jgi:hypothetical protein
VCDLAGVQPIVHLGDDRLRCWHIVCVRVVKLVVVESIHKFLVGPPKIGAQELIVTESMARITKFSRSHRNDGQKRFGISHSLSLSLGKVNFLV